MDSDLMKLLLNYYDMFAISWYIASISIDKVLQVINRIKQKYILFETHINRQNELEIIKNILIKDDKYKIICNNKFKAYAYVN
jgi:hypothetical protein